MGSTGETSPRQPVVFDPWTRRLSVGDRSTVVPDVADNNEAMLRGYLAVVAQARRTAVCSLTEVRQHDVVVLAQLLDLEDDDLEARFIRLLGMSPAVAADTRRRIAMHRAVLATAGITVGVLLTGGAASASATGRASSVAPAAVSVAAAVSTQAEPVPATDQDDRVEIGDALVIERGTQPHDPNVQIGDAVTYER